MVPWVLGRQDQAESQLCFWKQQHHVDLASCVSQAGIPEVLKISRTELGKWESSTARNVLAPHPDSSLGSHRAPASLP